MLAALIVCLVGFRKYIWLISIAYGLSISAIALMLLLLFGTVSSTGQWIVAIIGYLGIVYIMFSRARRLEIRQDKNYGGDIAYRKYKASSNPPPTGF